MATSQDFVNWICSERLDPDFLARLLIAEGHSLLRFASGAIHQTIYYPQVKAFHVCIPPIREQKLIVSKLNALDEETAHLEELLEKQAWSLNQLKRSIVIKAFSGELIAPPIRSRREAAE